MKGTGNSLRTILQKLHFYLIPDSGRRTRYIIKHRHQFHKIGDRIFWQSRKFPSDPEMISIGDNVKIASGVVFINHDIIHFMLNDSQKFTNRFSKYEGCIEIGDNVMIGADTIILPNVRIGSNVIIGAGSIVTKDLPSNCVAAGIPCNVIKSFEGIVEKYKKCKKMSIEELWSDFYEKRK